MNTALFPLRALLKGPTAFFMGPLARGSCGLVTKGPYLLVLVVLLGEQFVPRGQPRQHLQLLVVTAVGEKGAVGIEFVEARETAEHSWDRPLQRIIQPKVLIAPSLRNSGVRYLISYFLLLNGRYIHMIQTQRI